MELTLAPLREGALAIGHRPQLRKLAALRDHGVTHVVTVLSSSENPHAIGEAAQRAGLDWLWVDLGSTKSLPSARRVDLQDAVAKMAAILRGGGKLYLHCSAGIHRTGMMAAALLFHLGHDEAQTREMLARLRAVTAQDVGAERLEWARKLANATRSVTQK
jgi:hypothetical protein